MARDISISEKESILVVNRQEATNIIGLLSAQLADKPLKNNAAGESPEIRAVQDGLIQKIIYILLE